MSQYELQVSVPAFLAAQRHALQSRQICSAEPLDAGGIAFQVQLLELGNNAIRHDKPATFHVFFMSHGESHGRIADGFQTQIAQDVVLHVARLDDVLANPDQAAPILFKVPVRIVMDLDYYVDQNGHCWQRIALGGFEWEDAALPQLPSGVGVAGAKSTAEQLISARFRPVVLPLDLALPLTPKGAAPQVINAGVTVDTALRFLVFRVEVGHSTDAVDVRWSNFHQGHVPDRRQDSDWAFYVAKGMLEISLQTAVEAEVQGSLPGEAQLISVGSVYGSAGGSPQVVTTLHVNYDLPDPLGTKYLTPAIRTDLSIEPLNQLVIDAYLPDIEEFVEGMLAPARALLRMLPPPLNMAFTALLDSAAADVKNPEITLDDRCAEVAPLHQRCRRFLPLPEVTDGQLRMNQLIALDDGIVFAGSLAVPPLADGQLESWFDEFKWVVPAGSCDAASAALAAKLADSPHLAPAEARVYLQHTGTRPAYLCGFQVLNDPLGVFPPNAIVPDDERLPASYVIRIPNPGAAYAAAPYPLDLLVHTTAGSRLVRVPPVPELTEQDLTALVAEQLYIVANCKTATAPWWLYPDGFNPKWHFDPAFDKLGEHLWRFEMTGLHADDAVKLVDSGEATMLATRPTAGNRAKLSTVLSKIEEQGLRVSRIGLRRSDDEDESQRGIGITQQLLITQAIVHLPSPCRRIVAVASGGGRDVAAVLTDGVVVFDLSTPSRPRLTHNWQLPEVQCVLDRPSGLVAVTGDGLFELDPEAGVTRLGPAEEPHRLLDATPAPGGGVYVLTAQTLDLRAEDFQVRDSIGVAGATTLARLGDQVVVGGPEGVTVYGTPAGGGWGESGARPQTGLPVVRLLAHDEAPGDSLLGILDDGTARTLTIRDGVVNETTEYASPPWFAISVQVDGLLVRTSDSRQALVVSRFGESRRLGAEAMVPVRA